MYTKRTHIKSNYRTILIWRLSIHLQVNYTNRSAQFRTLLGLFLANLVNLLQRFQRTFLQVVFYTWQWQFSWCWNLHLWSCYISSSQLFYMDHVQHTPCKKIFLLQNKIKHKIRNQESWPKEKVENSFWNRQILWILN